MQDLRYFASAGIVILMLDSKLEPPIARDMVKGAPDMLHSEFRLGYSMLLNLMRGEGRLQAKELLAASFKQFQVEQALPALQAKIDSLEVCFHGPHHDPGETPPMVMTAMDLSTRSLICRSSFVIHGMLVLSWSAPLSNVKNMHFPSRQM